MNTPANDEIQLTQIFEILIKKKFFIIGVTLISFLTGLFYSVSIENEYTSISILQAQDEDQSGSNLIDQYSSVAALAGISLPSRGSSNSSLTTIEIIKSRDFFKHLLSFDNVKADLAAAKTFDGVTGKIIYDENIYDSVSGKWLMKARDNSSITPTYLELYPKYRSILDITRNKDTGLIKISVKHLSPNFANDFLSLIIEQINEISRNKDIKLTKKSLDFLENKLKNTNKTDIKQTLNVLIVEELKKQMLINVSKYYVLEPIDSPFTPESKSGPNRIQICILFMILGSMFSIIWVLIRFLYKIS